MNPVPQKSRDDSYLGLINDINRKISASSDVIEVLGYMLDSLREIIPYESGAVFLVNPRTQRVKYAVHRGSSGLDGTQFPTEIVRLAERDPARYHLDSSGAG